MRIIHTSDWHLGQHFMGKSRAAEHSAFLAWLLEQINRLKVDAVIIAGDVFDTGAPPSYARELYNGFVVASQQQGCQLIVLGGNHDSVAMLNESKALLACLNTQVIPAVMDSPKDQVLTLYSLHSDKKNKHVKNAIAAIVCAIPFIRPRDVLASRAGQSGQEKQQDMQNAIANHYAEVYKHAVILRDSLAQPVPIIATGHLTTVGVTRSESVRDIYIGTLDAFPANAFPPADYIALGHIHRSQVVAKSSHIRYSGSPIPLSFDETGGNKQTKSVLLVDFNKGELDNIKPLAIPQFQPMQVIKGDLKQIETELDNLLTSRSDADETPIWLEILVSTQDYLSDIQQRIEQLTAGLPVEVLLIRRDHQKNKSLLQTEIKETLNELSVNEVFERRLSVCEWDDETEKELIERLKQKFTQVVEAIETGITDEDP